MSAEHIVAAAIRKDDKVFKDFDHGSAYQTAGTALGINWEDAYGTWEEGFLTNTGRFVDRDEAYVIAKRAQQYQAAPSKDPNEPWLEYAEVEHDSRYFPGQTAESIVDALLESEAESTSSRAFLLSYYPRRNYRHEVAVCVIEGKHTPARIMKALRSGAEQLAGRRLSWARNEIRVQIDSDCDPAKARATTDFDKIVLGVDGSLTVERKSGGVKEALLLESPRIPTLKSNKRPLTSEERQQVMGAKAVWRMGRAGGPSPAVWKAVVNGKTWFVSNTHRCYSADRTLKAAIQNFFKVVEPSA